jgi:hypothetical protein
LSFIDIKVEIKENKMESSAELSSEEMDLDLENVGDQNDAKNTKDQTTKSSSPRCTNKMLKITSV